MAHGTWPIILPFATLHYTEDELNYTVQQTIDRIIFLRIAEDREWKNMADCKACIS